MDYLSCKAAVLEAGQYFVGSRLKDASCPAPTEAHLLFEGRNPLVLSIYPERPGLFIAPSKGISKGMISGFSDILRARLKGARLTGMTMPLPGERIVEMSFEAPWPGRPGEIYRLIFEIMGRHSNLILLDTESRILSPLKTVPEDKSRIRPILSGLTWTPPPPRSGVPIEEAHRNDLNIDAVYDRAAALTEHVSGMSPAAARQAIAMVTAEMVSDINSALSELVSQADGRSGYNYTLEGRHYLSSFMPVEADPGSIESHSPFSAAAWHWRSDTVPAETTQENSHRAHLEKRLESLRARFFRELDGVVREESRCHEHEEVRLKAETVLNNLHNVPRGTRNISLPRSDSPEISFDIELIPSLSAQENAQRMFELAKRLKRGLSEVTQRKTELQTGLARIEDALLTLEAGESAEAEKVLASGGPVAGRPDPHDIQPRGPGRAYTHSGFRILVGRSAADNEKVTFKAAGPHDLWLHARDYPGSHVVILAEKKNIPEEVVRYAATLAARSSGTKGDSSAEVMVTQRKWVRKIKGGKPGQVRVERFRS
ncbi:MAG: NFACT family protein, partial [bacterium]